MKAEKFKYLPQLNGLMYKLQPLPLMFIPPPTLYHRGLRLLKVKPTPVVATETSQLRSLIEEQIRIYGEDCDLNHIDVSQMKDMTRLFACLPFNGDISQWDVSNVEVMIEMFEHSPFKGDISRWNTSKVYSMNRMFDGALFNGDISRWNTSNVETMVSMFRGSDFNRNIEQWDVSKVRNMESMFADSKFNGNISTWNVGGVQQMRAMFRTSDFHGDLSKWNVSNVNDMSHLFEDTTYERDISTWKISPDCNILLAAPKYYGESPLFLACALADGKTEPSKSISSPRYQEAYAMVEGLGIQGIEAGYAMFQIMRGQPLLDRAPTCGLSDFS